MERENNYKAPDLARIGHVHLKVSDLNKSPEFYQELTRRIVKVIKTH